MAIEIHFEKRIHNFTVVREADVRHRRDYLAMIFLCAVLVFSLLFYGWQHYRWINYGYRIEEAQNKRDELREAGRQLALDSAFLSSPQRIDAIARGELGMVMAAPGQVITFHSAAPFTIPSPVDAYQPELSAKR